MSKRMYRHAVTGIVSEIDPSVAAAMGDALVEVGPDAKNKLPLTEVVEKAKPRTKSTSEKEK